MLASGSEFVDWRSWLLAASMPWIYPTQTQLLELLQLYRGADRANTGIIGKSTYLQIPFWFRIDKNQTPLDATKPHSFDRQFNLTSFWFDLFAVDEKLDYTNMVQIYSN